MAALVVSAASAASAAEEASAIYIYISFYLILSEFVKMASVLLQLLERTELNKLPKGVQNKLERVVIALQNANKSLKNQHERLKADSGR